ncbi:MAG: acireductone synthase [Armatimonadetes bacterium]|nr:acireductone synthase [Armatimonadota bacterium]
MSLPAAYLLDIEGTITPVDFVTRILFPYARVRLAEWLARPCVELDQELAWLSEEYASEVSLVPDWSERPTAVHAIDYLEFLMDQDRKSRGLKSLQGRIWKAGFEAGELRGEFYDDVLPALQRWQNRGAKIAIYSSGSVLAQKQLVKYAVAGDLSAYFEAHFDTAVGGKKEPGSYETIARELGLEPGQIHFLSDIDAEIQAARSAGMQATQVVRDGALSAPDQIATLDGLP